MVFRTYKNGTRLANFDSLEIEDKLSLDDLEVRDVDSNVAVALPSGKYGTSTNSSYYSTDGITWTVNALPQSAKWSSATYGNNKFVAVAYEYSWQGGTDIAIYSTDGISWSQTSLPSGSWLSVTYGDGKFVAVGYLSAAYSTDGITWTASSMPAYSSAGTDVKKWNSVIYGEGKFVSVADYGAISAYSTDGITWSSTTSISNDWISLTYGNNSFVAVTKNTDFVNVSTDGITWNRNNNLSQSAERFSISYGNSVFVAVAYLSNDYPGAENDIASYSTDGVTWQSSTVPSNLYWEKIFFALNKFIVLGNGSSTTMQSEDGITWTLIAAPAPSLFLKAATEGTVILNRSSRELF